MNKSILALLLRHPDNLLNKDCVIDYFTECQINTDTELVGVSNRLNTNVYPGKLLTVGDKIHVITTMETNSKFETEEVSGVSKKDQPFLDFNEPVSIASKFIGNLSGDKPITTTIGRFLLNHTLIVIPVGDKIPYENGIWNTNTTEDKIVELAVDGEITVDQIKKYINNVHFISGYSEFVVPSLSAASITVDPRVIALRDKLLKEYTGRFDDPAVMIDIETQIVALDKEILSKDPNAGFLIKGSNFSTHRKRMFLLMGILPAFGDEDKAFNFSTTDLDSGWKVEDVDVLFNDVRNGSYSRAKETAKGGAESKYLGRAFQESRITENDCGSKKGVIIHLTGDNIDSFMYRRIGTGKDSVIITKNNRSKYTNKTVVIRSPMYCVAKHGYCYACMDSRFKTIGLRRLNTLPLSIGSTFLTNSMKKMHGSSVDTFEITTDVLAQASIG